MDGPTEPTGPAGPAGPAVPTMADVARAAGVSMATVSRALRDLPGVSPGTRERIRRVADELAYVVSPEASGLSSGTTGRVAVVLPRLDTWFYSTILARMVHTLRDRELDVLLYQVDGEEQRTRFLQELPARRKVDAVILTALPMGQREVERLDLIGVHVVVAGGTLRDYPHVAVDELQVGATAVRHLVEQGHRRIGMIRTSDTDGTAWSSDVLRTQGWHDTLVDAALEPAPELLVTERYGVDAGARGLDRLLALADPPTAVFAYSDELAFAAVTRARSAGLRVPDDLSVIGVDGHPLGQVLGVTTVDQHVADQGRLAAELALRLLDGSDAVPATRVEAELVDRGSTAAPRPPA
jgi:LacI family transcriptional regulator, repressor for deo operon, udp, cdd, tsx, nupC, and nupG